MVEDDFFPIWNLLNMCQIWATYCEIVQYTPICITIRWLGFKLQKAIVYELNGEQRKPKLPQTKFEFFFFFFKCISYKTPKGPKLLLIIDKPAKANRSECKEITLICIDNCINPKESIYWRCYQRLKSKINQELDRISYS